MENPESFLVMPKSALLTYDCSTFGSMDPYVIITIGDKVRQTKTAFNMGKKPVWDDVLMFDIKNEQTLHVSLWDQDDFTKDDFICETHINITRILEKIVYQEQYPLYRKGKDVGTISINFSVYRKDFDDHVEQAYQYDVNNPVQGYQVPVNSLEIVQPNGQSSYQGHNEPYGAIPYGDGNYDIPQVQQNGQAMYEVYNNAAPGQYGNNNQTYSHSRGY